MSAETTSEHRCNRRALAARRREAIRAAKVTARFRRRYATELRSQERVGFVLNFCIIAFLFAVAALLL